MQRRYIVWVYITLKVSSNCIQVKEIVAERHCKDCHSAEMPTHGKSVSLNSTRPYRPLISMRRAEHGAILSSGWNVNHDLCACLSTVCHEILVRWHWWLRKFEKALGLDVFQCRVIAFHWGEDLQYLNLYVYRLGWHMLVSDSCSKCEVQKCF